MRNLVLTTLLMAVCLPAGSAFAQDLCGASVSSIEYTNWSNVICADGSGHSLIECDPAQQDANMSACQDRAHEFCSYHLLSCAQYHCPAGTMEQRGDCFCGSQAIQCAKSVNGW